MQSEAKQEQVEFKLSYERTFYDDRGSVAFRYKAAQKQNKGILNGIFKFRIDGVEQPLRTGVTLSDAWLDA